jgi:outer membrane protein assembly factor BamB
MPVEENIEGGWAMSNVAKSLLITAVCAVCVSGVQAQSMDWPMYGHDLHHSQSMDWPMYGHDLHHSFAGVDSAISAQNAGSMVRAWVFIPGDVVSASPTVVDGVVYVGSWDGFFYALDAASGAVKWKFQVDCDNAVIPVPPQCLAPGQLPPDRTTTDGGLITSSATMSNGVVYFAGGKTVYALDSLHGQLLWKRVLCGNPDAPNCESDVKDPTKIFSSPMIFDGKILLGQTADGVTGYRGAITALNVADGRTAWRFEVDPILSNGQVIGAYNRGCGSVWSTGAVDGINNLVAFGTGDCQHNATPPYHEAVLALDIDSGALRWVFQPASDLINGCDFDFGASANIFDIGTNRYVGIGNKNGTYYVLRSDTGQLLWKTNVVFGGFSGGFIGSTAFDGTRIYGGTGYGDFGATLCDPSNPRDLALQDPSFHAFNLTNGAIEWERDFSYTFGASTVANGVVFNGTAGLPGTPLVPALQAFDATTGQLVGEFPMPGSVNSSATIVGNMIFFGTGNSFNGVGSSVQAFCIIVRRGQLQRTAPCSS